MADLQSHLNNRFYFIFPKKDDKCFEQDWHDFSRIAISGYMQDPWFIKVHPNALDRRDYLEKYVNDVYDNYLLKDNAIFGALKIAGSKYGVVGGTCFRKISNECYTENPQNMDEVRLNCMYKNIYSPLKSIADKHGAELWEGTLMTIETALAKEKFGRILASKEFREKLMKKFSHHFKKKDHMPLILGVMMHGKMKDFHIQRSGFVPIGSVTYRDDAFGEVTDHVVSKQIPGTSEMLKEAKSLFMPSKI